MRSYSRTMGHTSLDRDTGSSGASRWMISRTAFSLAGMAVAVQQRDDDALAPSALAAVNGRGDARLVDGRQLGAVGSDALGDAETRGRA